MASYNRVVLLGNLTKDPELRQTSGGTSVANLSIAVNEYRKDQEDKVSFFDLTLWGRNAEVADEYLSKGSAALFEGRLEQDRWESEDGSKRSKVFVTVERLQLLGKNAGGESAPKHKETAGAGASATDRDIPF